MAVNIKKKISSFPARPGIYMMKNAGGEVVYVGKAANIKKRVASYFSKSLLPYKNQRMAESVSDVEFIVTPTEHEAFLLESRLIKSLKPYFNISLKDDKSFPFIKVTKQPYPRVVIGRKRPKEDVEYFGPYTNTKFLRIALKAIRGIFPFRSCRDFSKRACLNYHLGLCSAPCIDKISEAGYKKMIGDFKYFLKNSRESLIGKLNQKMQSFAERHKFEEAAKIRDKIRALAMLSEQSRPGLSGTLGLSKEPERIEAFDISNLQGEEAVGSMVTFINCKPSKSNYRRFRIRETGGIDDYKMLKEVLERRYSRMAREKSERPGLIVIDGGRGHLSVARRHLHKLGVNIPIIAIAKNQELIYTVSNNAPLRLAKDNPALQLIQHIRDEAHRFAINYHRLLRSKKDFTK